MIIRHEAFDNISIINSDFLNQFSKIRTYNELIKLITTMSKEYQQFDYLDSIKRFHPDFDLMSEIQIKSIAENKFKGDLFEIFAEGFLHLMGSYPTIGVSGYKPVTSYDDNGIDGYGVGIDGKPLTVQIKFRTNSTYELRRNEISYFGWLSIHPPFNVELDSKNFVIFTNCEGIHFSTKETYFNKLRIINGKIIKGIIDNNANFWNNFSELIENSL